MTRRTGPGVVGVALAAALLSACAGPPQGGAMSSEPATPPPSSEAASPRPTAQDPSRVAPADGKRPVAPADGTRPPLSSTELPRMKPARPPKKPTDLVPTDLVVGRVTRGGSGPCYGIIDEDGTDYAVYSTAGLSLSEGATVRIRFEQVKRTIDCGAGRPIHAREIVVLR